MMNKKSGRGSIVLRLLKTIREFYPVMMPVTVVCIVFSAVVSSVPAIFMQNVIAVVEQSWRTGDWPLWEDRFSIWYQFWLYFMCCR